MSLIKQSESKLKELSNAETSELSDDQSKLYSILRKASKSLLLIHMYIFVGAYGLELI